MVYQITNNFINWTSWGVEALRTTEPPKYIWYKFQLDRLSVVVAFKDGYCRWDLTNNEETVDWNGREVQGRLRWRLISANRNRTNRTTRFRDRCQAVLGRVGLTDWLTTYRETLWGYNLMHGEMFGIYTVSQKKRGVEQCNKVFKKYYIRFIDHLLLFPTVKEFLKSVNSWWSYRKSSTPRFFWDTV